ncbi:hypothetical protein C8R44DRAFT_919442 [Mycena epipterygia]|nr:hypothetical protein C8R44DRAFT_919442 [Mycena epipterygia]
MLSRILILGIWAVSLAGVSIGQDTAELGSPNVAKSPLAVLESGFYNITQAHAGNVVVLQPDGNVYFLKGSPPALWRVDNVRGNYRIVSMEFKQAASAVGIQVRMPHFPCIRRSRDWNDGQSSVVLTADRPVWVIESAGENQWIVRTPDQDAVWKSSSRGAAIMLAKTDGTPAERWEFTPA